MVNSFFKLLTGRLCLSLHRIINDWASDAASKRLKNRFGKLGPNTQLAKDLKVDFAERVHIGEWVYIGPGGQFFGRGTINISDHTIIGPRVTIMSSMHNYKSARFIPYDELELLNPVQIGIACWVGFGAIIMPGVVLGQGCIVGAGSVVTKSFPDGSIVAGNPATTIRSRNMPNFMHLLNNGHTYLANKFLFNIEKHECKKENNQ